MSESDFNRLFAYNLRYQLAKKFWTQKELAEKLDVATSTVGYWTSAVKTPRMDKVDKMCELFNCKREDLLTEKTDEERQTEELMDRLLAAGGKLPNETLEPFVLALEAAAKACENR